MQLEPFTLTNAANCIGLAATNASGSVNVPTNMPLTVAAFRQVLVYNAASNPVALQTSSTSTPATAVFPTAGTGAVTAASLVVPAGAYVSFSIDPSTVSISGILSAGTGNVYFAFGVGF